MIKYMLLIIFGLLLAALTGHTMQQDSGYVLFMVGHTTVEMSFWIFAASAFSLVMALLIFMHYWAKSRQMFLVRQVRHERDVALALNNEVDNFLMNFAQGRYAVMRRRIPRFNANLVGWWQGYLALKLHEKLPSEDKLGDFHEQMNLAAAVQEKIVPAKLPERAPTELWLALFPITLLEEQFASAKLVLQKLSESGLGRAECEQRRIELCAAELTYLVDRGDFTSALAEFNKLSRYERRQPQIALQAARLYHHKGESELAKEVIESALKANFDAALIMFYGKLSFSNLDKAYRQVQKWHKQYPRQSEPLILMGQMAMQEDKLSEAKSHFEAAIAIQPSPESFAALGDLLVELGQEGLALASYKKGCLKAYE